MSDKFTNRVGLFFWGIVIFNIVWFCACMVGLFFLGKAVIEWLNRN